MIRANVGVLARSGGGELPWPVEKFTGGDEVAVFTNISGTNHEYKLYQHVGNRNYWNVNMIYTNLVVGGDAMRMGYVYLREFFRGYNDITQLAVSLGGAWGSTSGTSYPGGKIFYSSTTGRSITLNIPIGANSVGIISGALSPGGIAKVEIDNNAAGAELLPTVQSLIDSGDLASTVLVANGGTLNPTDRVFNNHNIAANYGGPGAGGYVVFSRNINPATTHTVKITVTGYRVNASGNSTIYFNMFIVKGDSFGMKNSNGNHCFLPLLTLVSSQVPPAWEVSYNYKPTGATDKQWIGHVGTQKIKELPVLSVDGATITPTNNSFYFGDEFNLYMVQDLRHSHLGTVNQGLMTMNYKLDKVSGLTISHSITWMSNGIINGYPAMLSCDHALFDRFASYSFRTGVDLDKNDSLTYTLKTTGKTAYCWDYDGNVGMVMYIPDLQKTVENWVLAPTYALSWFDANAGWKKAYATRYENETAYSNGNIILSEVNYRCGWFPGGAHNELNQ